MGPVWRYLIADLGAWGLVAPPPPESTSQWGFTYRLCGAASLSRWKAPEETEHAKKITEGQQKVKGFVIMSCPKLCDPTDCSPPGSSVHRIFQSRTEYWSR